MAIHQKQVMTLQQKLSPQQIQMIKLLELPTVQLEQRIKQEIEENIVLEEAEQQNEEEEPQQISVDEYLREDDTPAYKMRANNYSKDDKPRQIPLSGGRSLQEYLIEQLGYRNLSEEEMRLAVYLVGSIDEDTATEVIPEKDSTVLVYCRSGNRSKTASSALAELGYTNIYEFGGISTWPYETES